MAGEKKEDTQVEIMAALNAFIDQHKAGSPMDESVYWIPFRASELSRAFATASGHRLSHGLIKRQLQKRGFKYRKMRKSKALGEVAYRDQQFKIICELVLLMTQNNPVISIDCKKKERLGNLYREGKCYCSGPIEVLDHDYDNLSEGKVIPHGIYDMQRNEGYISIGSCHETADFITDNLRWWWENFGIHHYPDATQILILCDAGGGNSYRHHAFKKQLILLAEDIGIDIIIAHYPPYTSKWNPIEHRLFPHVQQAIQGVPFTNYQQVKELFESTNTTKGLKVFVRLNLKTYTTGTKTKAEEIDPNKIDFHKDLPKLSYRIAA